MNEINQLKRNELPCPSRATFLQKCARNSKFRFLTGMVVLVQFYAGCLSVKDTRTRKKDPFKTSPDWWLEFVCGVKWGTWASRKPKGLLWDLAAMRQEGRLEQLWCLTVSPNLERGAGLFTLAAPGKQLLWITNMWFTCVKIQGMHMYLCVCMRTCICVAGHIL